MKQLLVLKNTTYANGVTTIDDINSLVEGGLAMFDGNNTLITAAGIATITDEEFYAFAGRAEMPNKSPLVNRDSMSFTKNPYQAPSVRVRMLGAEINGAAPTYDLNLPAAIEEGMVFGVKVSFPAKVMHRDPYTAYISVAANAIDTFDTVMANLLAKLNSRLEGITVTTHTNAGAVTGFVFTGNAVGYDFDILGMDALMYSDNLSYHTVNRAYVAAFTTIAEFKKGANTNADLKALEVICLAEVGKDDTATDKQQIWSEASYIDPSITYTKYVINWMNARKNVPSMKTTYEQTLYLLVPTAAAALITELDSILAGL